MTAGPAMDLFAGGFLLALRVAGAGGSWSTGHDAPGGANGPDGFLFRLGRTMAVGLLLNLLPALALASMGAWTPLADWVLWLLIVVAGLVRAVRRGGGAKASLIRCAEALALIWAITAIPLLQPPRSEWLAGGWDPGLYQNNAVVIERLGGLQARPDSIYSAMTADERLLLSTPEGRYREVLPAVPIRIEDGSLPLYFFHLTPVCGAWFLRLGGMGLLFRMPAILTMWGLLPMLALCEIVGMGGWRKWLLLACWLLSPLWWYHQSQPTTEMLYLLLLLGGVLLYVPAAARGLRLPWGALAALFAATVNHLNAAVLASVLLVVAAFVEGGFRSPGRVWRIGLALGVLVLAIAWNLHFAGITVMRLEDKDQALRTILVCLAGSTALALWLAWRPVPAAIRAPVIRWGSFAGAAAGITLAVGALATIPAPLRVAMLQTAQSLPGVGPALVYLIRTVPFQGALAMAWAGLGWAWLFLSRDDALRPAKTTTCALGLVCLLLIVQPGIAPIYPWALRRVVVFWMPLLAFGQGMAVLRAMESIRARGGRWRWGALLILAPAVAQSLQLSLSAARTGDYPGFGRLLASWEQIIEPGAVVVADDPRWGTPLLLAGGRDVVNGRLLWESRDPGFQRRFLEALQRVRETSGRRILWLTSTAKGLGIYPVEWRGDPDPRMEMSYAFHTVIHSARGDEYAVAPQERRFRLYEWESPGDPSAGGRAD